MRLLALVTPRSVVAAAGGGGRRHRGGAGGVLLGVVCRRRRHGEQPDEQPVPRGAEGQRQERPSRSIASGRSVGLFDGLLFLRPLSSAVWQLYCRSDGQASC